MMHKSLDPTSAQHVPAFSAEPKPSANQEAEPGSATLCLSPSQAGSGRTEGVATDPVFVAELQSLLAEWQNGRTGSARHIMGWQNPLHTGQNFF